MNEFSTKSEQHLTTLYQKFKIFAGLLKFPVLGYITMIKSFLRRNFVTYEYYHFPGPACPSTMHQWRWRRHRSTPLFKFCAWVWLHSYTTQLPKVNFQSLFSHICQSQIVSQTQQLLNKQDRNTHSTLWTRTSVNQCIVPGSSPRDYLIGYHSLNSWTVAPPGWECTRAWFQTSHLFVEPSFTTLENCFVDKGAGYHVCIL